MKVDNDDYAGLLAPMLDIFFYKIMHTRVHNVFSYFMNKSGDFGEIKVRKLPKL